MECRIILQSLVGGLDESEDTAAGTPDVHIHCLHQSLRLAGPARLAQASGVPTKERHISSRLLDEPVCSLFSSKPG